MKVEIFRLSSQPVEIEVREGGTVRDVFSTPGSGKAVGRESQTLLDAAEDLYGGVDGLGTLRVDGAAATLDSAVRPGSTIFLIPKVEGGSTARVVG